MHRLAWLNIILVAGNRRPNILTMRTRSILRSCPARLGKALSESMAGQRDAALVLLNKTEDEMEARGVADSEFKYKMAQAYAVLGEKSAALHMLQHTVEGGFFC